MKLKSIITYTALIASCLLPTACHSDGEPPLSPEDKGSVTLVLKMSVNSGVSNTASGSKNVCMAASTRADDYTFEAQDNVYEGVRTFRILIIRRLPDTSAGSQPGDSINIVEYNDLFSYPLPENVEWWKDGREYRYKVAGGEKKLIYLIANEASVGENFVADLEEMTEEKRVNLTVLDDAKLETKDGGPFINNSSSEGKRFVPMTEMFSANIPLQGVNQSLEYKLENSLFLTRTLSKYSFAIDVNNSAADFGINGLKITSISFSGDDGKGCFADKEWLIPHGMAGVTDGTVGIAGGAIYNPGKYDPSTEKLNGKAIVEFTTPEDAKMYDYKFEPEGFGIKGTKDNTNLSSLYAPLEYFLETPAKEFYVTVTGESNGLERSFGPVLLPNLPYLARNTHVQIQFSFSGETLEAEVDVVPYIGIELKPGFGFDQLLPGDHHQPSDW